PARLQDALQRGDCCTEVVNVVESLSQDDAIELVRADMPGAGEIGNNRRAGVVRMDVEDVAAVYAVAAELASVSVVADLEHVAMDAVGIGGKESLDVIAIDRETSVAAKLPADRHHPAQAAEVNRFEWRVETASIPPDLQPVTDGRRNDAPDDSECEGLCVSPGDLACGVLAKAGIELVGRLVEHKRRRLAASTNQRQRSVGSGT